ncbi:hypothetical protein DFA_02611 [Cavenderia fasciculata]|uniref:Uncharacterized protein n=1 Tax=Cavenderia fasciculata TaxID=261658 RepID=F4PZV8_CACFS|nr:uncharacterized protein DFA_02611 [Cavenderia fasciculata]EGG18872.1 hypothetical protein DFA_02611 [Cavenderia fasciculata]|eukprot:XP_004357334.1 hypothetical protein DFA_02611 [Cavenderia fasciculata]
MACDCHIDTRVIVRWCPTRAHALLATSAKAVGVTRAWVAGSVHAKDEVAARVHKVEVARPLGLRNRLKVGRRAPSHGVLRRRHHRDEVVE